MLSFCWSYGADGKKEDITVLSRNSRCAPDARGTPGCVHSTELQSKAGSNRCWEARKDAVKRPSQCSTEGEQDPPAWGHVPREQAVPGNRGKFPYGQLNRRVAFSQGRRTLDRGKRRCSVQSRRRPARLGFFHPS